jgi:hypothetical protein
MNRAARLLAERQAGQERGEQLGRELGQLQAAAPGRQAVSAGVSGAPDSWLLQIVQGLGDRGAFRQEGRRL